MAEPAVRFEGEDFVDERERLAKLESDVAHIDKTVGEIRSDMRELNKKMDDLFRWLLGAYAGGMLFTLGAMAAGFFWLASRLP